MSMTDRLKVEFPYITCTEIDRWIAAGRDYAARLDKLPPVEQEAVTYLFAAYGICRIARYKAALRSGIDVVIRPYYPGVDHHAPVT